MRKGVFRTEHSLDVELAIWIGDRSSREDAGAPPRSREIEDERERLTYQVDRYGFLSWGARARYA
jgi:hypothetical protein